MTDYIEALCTLHGDDTGVAEVAVALLAELGFESFLVDGSEVKAYIRDDLYDACVLREWAEEHAATVASVKVGRIPQENWNREWESDFPMTVIADRCLIHAPFHLNPPAMEYTINILPQMSFGTGHHETTALMAEMMLEENMAGKRVFDVGCGTGILAILASMMQARHILAVDIDEWAYRSAVENCARNGVRNVEVRQGDGSVATGRRFDLILANIGRNVLLSSFPLFAECLQGGGVLQASGFHTGDLPGINAEAERNGLKYLRHVVRNDWAAAQYAPKDRAVK
ncbi:MAG: 50S ribosomal protein L11 methyltransferase [Bacteroidales bacterium]|jgi:ribosomal protein L11 methyltransferase|nr:50S ribosomal protein L11 methyltransferase [Bacteroidales bacterium]